MRSWEVVQEVLAVTYRHWSDGFHWRVAVWLKGMGLLHLHMLC